MKQLSIFSILLLLVSCSFTKVVHDKFDQTSEIRLKLKGSPYFFKTLDGEIKIIEINFSKGSESKLFSDINMFCKFEGFNGEMLEGETIEISMDGEIFKLPLREARFGDYEIETGTAVTMFTRLGPFTFSDSVRSNIHIIVMEMTISKEIQEAILASKKIMIRILTRNIDGISKNTFRYKSIAVSNLKKFIKRSPVV